MPLGGQTEKAHCKLPSESYLGSLIGSRKSRPTLSVHPKKIDVAPDLSRQMPVVSGLSLKWLKARFPTSSVIYIQIEFTKNQDLPGNELLEYIVR